MDHEITMRAAAEARAAGVAAPADRPSQRRCAPDESSGAWASARAAGMTIRETADSGTLTFEGYATVYEAGYEMYDWYGPYTEIVTAGAASNTLAREGLDVPLVLQHDALRRIARTTNGTLTLSEDEHGLHVLAHSLDPEDHDVAYIAPKLRAGLIDEMSFKFRIVRGEWSPDYTQYRISEFDLHRGDVAIVGYGANPATAGSGLRSDDDVTELVRTLTDTQALTAHAALAERLATVGRALPAAWVGEDLLLPLV